MTCAVKGCKTSPASFPLHFHDAELELQELDFQAEFIQNIIPRLDWDGLQVTVNEVTFKVLSDHCCCALYWWCFIAWLSQNSRHKTRGWCLEWWADSEGPAPITSGDPGHGREIEMWELWPRVYDQRRNCKFSSPQSFGSVRPRSRWIAHVWLLADLLQFKNLRVDDSWTLYSVQSTNMRIKLNIMHAHRTTGVENNPLGIMYRRGS